jgi:hypothetical protein
MGFLSILNSEIKSTMINYKIPVNDEQKYKCGWNYGVGDTRKIFTINTFKDYFRLALWSGSYKIKNDSLIMSGDLLDNKRITFFLRKD